MAKATRGAASAGAEAGPLRVGLNLLHALPGIGGVIAFALLGVGWSALCGFLLSPARLFDHPLTPFFVAFAMRVEQPLGNLLGSLRDLAVPLLVLFVLSLILGRRL